MFILGVVQANPQVTLHGHHVRNFNDCASGLSNSLTYPKLSSYIAGLIEGDGTFYVPQLERAPSGELYYPAVQIAFAQKDYPLAAYLRLVIGHGSINNAPGGQKAYIYTINNMVGLVTLVNLINGLMRTPKVAGLNKLINYLNRKDPSLSLQSMPLDTSPLSSNA